MSEDIVTILRQFALAEDSEVENCVFTDAADAIEELRVELDLSLATTVRWINEAERLRADLAASEANLAALQARWDARPVPGFTDVYGNSLGVSDTCTDCGCERYKHDLGTGPCGVARCGCDGFVPYGGK